MKKNLFKKVMQNWFQFAVIILLILCYVRLGQIKESTFYTADMVDDSTRRLMYSLDDIYSRMGDVQSDVQSIYYEVQ